MSDKENPFGAFGRGERTIIRPNPGARRPTPAAPAGPGAPAPPYPAAPPAPYAPAAPYGAGPAPAHAYPVSGAPYQPAPNHGPLPVNPYPISGAPSAYPPQGYPPAPGYPPPPAYPPAQGYPPPGYPPQAPPGYAPPPGYPPPGAMPYATPGATPTPEEWIKTQQQQPQAPAAPRHIELRIDELAAPHENPMMRAAGPLLLLLGRLRVALMRASFAQLMEQVAEAINFFERDIRSAGIPEDQANTAKYILCATADDIVQNIPTEDRHVWTQYSMLARFFGERIGGVRFFDELERALRDPLVNYPLLELFHTCLALGFQGMHRSSPNGQVALGQIQRNVYETLRRVRPKVIHDLSPRWKGQALASESSRLRVPVWVVGSASVAALIGLFIILRALLGGNSDAVAGTVMTLHPMDKVDIARRVIAPPPPPPPPPVDRITQLQRVRNALAPEIARGQINVVQTGNAIIIRVGDLILFESGQAVVREQFKPVAARIVEMLEKETGWVKIIGHTDNIPIRNARFPNNFILSQERAKAVSAVLQPGLTQKNRLETSGKGEEMPVAPNDTSDGRAKNRRVEVLIQRTD